MKVRKSGVLQNTATNVVKKAGRNRLMPDANATGPHTVFRRDPISGSVSHYETFRPQTNSFDPKAWESVKRFDGSNLGPGQMAPSHFNKVLQQKIYEPHIHDPCYPGGIRPALPWETP